MKKLFFALILLLTLFGSTICYADAVDDQRLNDLLNTQGTTNQVLMLNDLPNTKFSWDKY